MCYFFIKFFYGPSYLSVPVHWTYYLNPWNLPFICVFLLEAILSKTGIKGREYLQSHLLNDRMDPEKLRPNSLKKLNRLWIKTLGFNLSRGEPKFGKKYLFRLVENRDSYLSRFLRKLSIQKDVLLIKVDPLVPH